MISWDEQPHGEDAIISFKSSLALSHADNHVSGRPQA